MKSCNLCLHAGGKIIDREALANTDTPQATETWQPIPHAVLLNQVESTLQKTGLAIINQSHATSHNHDRYFGLLQVANGHNSEDFSLVLGLRNSHDKKFPAGLAVGSSVFVCDNLAFSGEINLARRHTVNIMRDLPQLVTSAIGKLGHHRQVQETRFLSYKTADCSDRQAHDIIVQALDARVMPVTRIPDVLTQWRHPNHPEFSAERNIWRLLNAFTETMKDTDIQTLPKRTMSLMGLLDATVTANNPNSSTIIMPSVSA